MTWVLENSESKGLARLVLIALAYHANRESGACFPSMRTIAAEAGISVGVVPKLTKKLVELGELEVEKAGDSRRSTRYRLPFLSVHVVNAAFTPGARAAFTPGMNRTGTNPKEQLPAEESEERRDAGTRPWSGDAEVVPLFERGDLPSWMRERSKMRAVRAAARQPGGPARMPDPGAAGGSNDGSSAPAGASG